MSVVSYSVWKAETLVPGGLGCASDMIPSRNPIHPPLLLARLESERGTALENPHRVTIVPAFLHDHNALLRGLTESLPSSNSDVDTVLPFLPKQILALLW